METEVKLAFRSEEDLFAIINAEWFTDYCLDAAHHEPVRLENTYYDTPERRLNAKGAAVRVRRYHDEDGEKFEHTVKYGGGVANGLHQRYEWNVISDESEFRKSEFIKAAVSSDDPIELLEEILDGISDDELRPLCKTNFERTVYTFGFGDSIMEVCFDSGKIIAGDREEDICELELELESGDVVDLKEMGQFIVENTGAELFNESKFKRCLKLMGC